MSASTPSRSPFMARRPAAPPTTPAPTTRALAVTRTDAKRQLEERIKLGKDLSGSLSTSPARLIDPLFPQRDPPTYVRDSRSGPNITSTS
jgi:hypothetical protein